MVLAKLLILWMTHNEHLINISHNKLSFYHNKKSQPGGFGINLSIVEALNQMQLKECILYYIL